jgi:hypothetical protein
VEEQVPCSASSLCILPTTILWGFVFGLVFVLFWSQLQLSSFFVCFWFFVLHAGSPSGSS